MSNVILSNAKSTHYAVSTFAAVVYAIVWLATSHAHAETSTAATSMPEVVVTAQRETSQTAIPEVVVWGQREASAPAMQEVVVYGHRETTERVAATSVPTPLGTSALGTSARAGGFMIKVRHWLAAL